MKNADKQKHWVVYNPSLSTHTHVFYVTGDGCIYKSGGFRTADAELMEEIGHVNDAGTILDSITGIWYIPVDEGEKSKERRVGVTAQNIERVLPEAVTADEKGLLYVDYEALTVILIEAVKDQRHEIELLRKILEENGLMEPEQP